MSTKGTSCSSRRPRPCEGEAMKLTPAQRADQLRDELRRYGTVILSGKETLVAITAIASIKEWAARALLTEDTDPRAEGRDG